MKLTLNQLERYLLQGREIEFSLKHEKFFISTCRNSSNYNDYLFYIWDVNKKMEIARGTLSDIFSFQFANNIILQDNIQLFEFDYIL